MTMTERIVIKETDDPRTKLFAFSKKLAQCYVGTYRRNAGKIELTYLSSGTPTVYKDWNDTTKPFAELVFRLMDFAEVGEVEVINDCQIRITIAAASFWTDLNDDIQVFDHMIETIRHVHLKDAEPEIVTEGLSNADIRVFTGCASSNLFILSRPIVADSGDVSVSKNAQGEITGAAAAQADVVGRAILLHPNLAGVHIRGQFVRIDAGTGDGESMVPSDLTPDARAYAVAVLRVLVYEDKRITVYYSSTSDQPDSAMR